MYALRGGRLLWEHHVAPSPGAAFGPIVSSPAVADVGSKRLVVFGAGPHVYALDARDGREVWNYDASRGVKDTVTEFESSPLVHKGHVYIGIDTHDHPEDETGGARGGLVVLNAKTGRLSWFFAPEQRNKGEGCSSVWSSPTIDKRRNLVFLATGNCPADVEWTKYTEAVIALKAVVKGHTAKAIWSFQPHPPNRKDWDFGSTPNLFRSPNGTPVLGTGNKDGTYYAVDPATGRKLWATNVAAPGDVQDDFSVGGFLGSTAIDAGRVYGSTAIGGPPYFHALDGDSGKVLWNGVSGPGYGATATVNGVVFHGALDTLFKAFDAKTGALLWAADLLAPIASGPAIVGDRVYVGSGVSSSDLCGKGTAGDEACQSLFNDVLGSLGSITEFNLP